jgi:hypothetical protein
MRLRRWKREMGERDRLPVVVDCAAVPPTADLSRLINTTTSTLATHRTPNGRQHAHPHLARCLHRNTILRALDTARYWALSFRLARSGACGVGRQTSLLHPDASNGLPVHCNGIIAPNTSPMVDGASHLPDRIGTCAGCAFLDAVPRVAGRY